MKTCCIILFMVTALQGNTQTLSHFNGWEFLPWETDSAQVQVMVERNRKKLQGPDGLDADFKYQDLNTRLVYRDHKLYKVRQKEEFSVTRNKEAQALYEKTRDRMMKQYGNPQTEAHDTIQQIVQLQWDLEYTRIDFEYDYKYKIIDELGAGSYWVEIVFEEKQE